MKFFAAFFDSTIRRLIIAVFLFTAFAAGFLNLNKNFHHATVSAQTTVTVVNAASYDSSDTRALGPDTIAAAFGTFVTQNNQVFTANAVPLPTALGGVSVTINAVPAGLFFVSTGQINLQIPANIIDGAATIVVTNSDNTTRTGTFKVERASPGIFSFKSNGQGVAAAVVTPDGIGYQSVANPDGTERDVSAGTKASPNFLILYTTGVRYTPAANSTDGNGVAESVTVKFQGVPGRVDFAGPAPGLSGVDQINVVIPPEMSGFGSVNVTLTTNGRTSNAVTIKLGGQLAAVRPTAIAFGETKTGQLTVDDQVDKGDLGNTFFFDAYDFTTTTPNTVVAIDARSTDFNPAILISRVAGDGTLSQVGSDDDFGGMGNGSFVNKNALVIIVLTTPGRYAFYATSSDTQPNGTGSYTATLTVLNAPQLAYGSTVNDGNITTNDYKTSGGDYIDVYWFNGILNENVRVAMNSTALNSFLFLQSNDNIFFAFDDSGGGNNNALINAKLDSTQPFLIIATPFATNATGAYTLALSKTSFGPEASNQESGYTKEAGRELKTEDGDMPRLGASGMQRHGKGRVIE